MMTKDQLTYIAGAINQAPVASSADLRVKAAVLIWLADELEALHRAEASVAKVPLPE
jgi:hypothetical protein